VCYDEHEHGHEHGMVFLFWFVFGSFKYIYTFIDMCVHKKSQFLQFFSKKVAVVVMSYNKYIASAYVATAWLHVQIYI
jgi:hypothetical protein